MGILDKLKRGLQKTKQNISDRIDKVLVSFGKIDDDLFDELEEILIMSDMGTELSSKIVETIRQKVIDNKIIDPHEIKSLLKTEVTAVLESENVRIDMDTFPLVILVIGVNGVGKTTSIVKIANLFKQKDKKVIIAAGDTFRAAAIDQLEVWTNRLDIPLIKHSEGADPAAVIYDAINAAKARKAEVLVCDTAGRLHTKKNLMEELKKIHRIILREFSEANVETLLVIDSTTGQNAISQAKVFSEATRVTGIMLTKLDGTAKGGVAASIKHQLNIPIKLLGIGENADDIEIFDAKKFVEALLD